MRGTHFFKDRHHCFVEEGECGSKLFDERDFCFYEGEFSDGRPNGRGREYKKDERGNRVLYYEGEWKDGKKEGRGDLYSPNGVFYRRAFKDDKPCDAKVSEKIENKHLQILAKNVEMNPNTQLRPESLDQYRYIELYRRDNEDSKPIHVFSGYVLGENNYVLGTVYEENDENNPLFEGVFDKERQYDEYGTFYLNRLYSFVGCFRHGVPQKGRLLMNGVLLYEGEVNPCYAMDGQGVLFYMGKNKNALRSVKYEGAFARNAPNGFGRLYYKGEGEKGMVQYCGYFKDGLFDGRGVMVERDGSLHMSSNRNLSLEFLTTCSREDFDRVPDIQEWEEGQLNGDFDMMVGGARCKVQVRGSTMRLENYRTARGALLSGGVKAVGSNYQEGTEVILLGDMYVCFDGVVRVVKEEVVKELTFVNGVQTGQGSVTVNGREVFRGAFQNSLPHGAGVMTGPNGLKASGEWESGLLKSGRIEVSTQDGFFVYLLTRVTSEFSYLGGANQRISGEGVCERGTWKWEGRFEDGKMVLGRETVKSNVENMKENVRSIFVVNGVAVTLTYSIAEDDSIKYHQMTFPFDSIICHQEGVIEFQYNDNGVFKRKKYFCPPSNYPAFFVEKDVTLEERMKLVVKTEESWFANGKMTGHFYFVDQERVDVVNKKVYNAENEVVYEGELKMVKKDGREIPVREGQGVEYAHGGMVYNGEWKEGKRDGRGIEVADRTTYSGVWRKGVKEGVFVHSYGDGDIEEEWKKGVMVRRSNVSEVRDDSRVYRFTSSNRMTVTTLKGVLLYEGEYKRNVSILSFSFAPDSEYKGWKYLPNGQGNMYREEGREVWTGTWKEGQLNGEVTVERDGLRFTSRYTIDIPERQWKVYCGNEALFQGTITPDFLPNRGKFYITVNGVCAALKADANSINNHYKLNLESRNGSYCGCFCLESGFRLKLCGEGVWTEGVRKFEGTFLDNEMIDNCTVTENGEMVFYGVVRRMCFYAGCHKSRWNEEEGLFSGNALRDGYRRSIRDGKVSTVGDPERYEEVYRKEGMTFRNGISTIRPSSPYQSTTQSEGDKDPSVVLTKRNGEYFLDGNKVDAIEENNGVYVFIKKVGNGSVYSKFELDGASYQYVKNVIRLSWSVCYLEATSQQTRQILERCLYE